MTRFYNFTFSFLICLITFGCHDGSEKQDPKQLVGKWTFIATQEKSENQWKDCPIPQGMELSMVFRNNHTATISHSYQDNTISKDFTWDIGENNSYIIDGKNRGKIEITDNRCYIYTPNTLDPTTGQQIEGEFRDIYERTVSSSQTVYVPTAPTYSNKHMWYTVLNDTGQGADVFYIPSTWEFDWFTPDSLVSHWADPSRLQHREHMQTEMSKVAEYMADGNNFYSPYYRHITLNSWATLNEDSIHRRYQDVAWIDVKNAFQHYLTNYNQGRPFILAGFSQGGKSVVELMKTLPSDLRPQLIAAYILGYKVTPEDIKQAPWIKAAKRATDIGVAICYNSVSDVKYLKPVISAPNVMCINPVNWKTDATPAILHDTITVTLSPEHNILVLKGFDGSYLPNILDILNVGDYHGIEPWVYSECLRKNMKQRIEAYRQAVK